MYNKLNLSWREYWHKKQPDEAVVIEVLEAVRGIAKHPGLVDYELNGINAVGIAKWRLEQQARKAGVSVQVLQNQRTMEATAEKRKAGERAAADAKSAKEAAERERKLRIDAAVEELSEEENLEMFREAEAKLRAEPGSMWAGGRPVPWRLTSSLVRETIAKRLGLTVEPDPEIISAPTPDLAPARASPGPAALGSILSSLRVGGASDDKLR